MPPRNGGGANQVYLPMQKLEKATYKFDYKALFCEYFKSLDINLDILWSPAFHMLLWITMEDPRSGGYREMWISSPLPTPFKTRQ